MQPTKNKLFAICNFEQKNTSIKMKYSTFAANVVYLNMKFRIPFFVQGTGGMPVEKISKIILAQHVCIHKINSIAIAI